jgi:hypothetical protein
MSEKIKDLIIVDLILKDRDDYICIHSGFLYLS